MNKTCLTISYFLTFFIISVSASLGDDVCVYSETSLQDALDDAAVSGEHDVIRIVQGNYYENFYYTSNQGKDITLLGGYTSGCSERLVDPRNTVLDGGETDRVLYLYNSDGGSIQIEGFTIQNGHSSSSGAGLYAASYSDSGPSGIVTLANNIIKDNTGSDSGGGAYARSQSTASAAGNIFLSNNILIGNTSGSYGGGGLAYSRSISSTAGNVTLMNNIITGNTTTADAGGGVYASSNSDSVEISGGTVSLINNTITGNTSASGGGGFFTWRDANTTNCYNNIIWGNTAGSGGDDIYLGSSGTAYGYNNAYSIILGGWTNANGNNIHVNPLLTGNSHLKPGSPCIDAGNNFPPGSFPAKDIDGDDRKIDGDHNGTAIVDIGADEYSPKGLISHLLMLLLN